MMQGTGIHTRDRALTVVEDFHEATRLYPATRTGWGRRVAHFNTNEKARARLLRPEHRFGRGWPAGDTARSADMLELLGARKSERLFSSEPVQFETVKDVILAATCPPVDGHANENSHASTHRPYASAGGIYSVDHYVIGLRVNGPIPAPFVAYCCPTRRAVVPVRSGLDAAFCNKALGTAADDTLDPAFAVVQAANLDRATRKYQERGYRFALLEAGLAAQNICLLSNANGFSALIWGGHHDDALDRLLSIRGTEATALNTILLGGYHQ
ncbi:MAG: SagB/ThcOx family dehydrogenase [Pseudomonadota bacterium]